MITLLQIELFKIFRKWRSYIGFFTIAILVVLIETAMYIEGQKYLDFLTRSISAQFEFYGNFLNGYLIAHLVLGSLTIHIPFLIALVAGDLLAGEATAGTYRLIIPRPVSRLKLLSAKFIAGLLYTFMLVFFLAVISLGLGVILFGTGELIVIKQTIIILSRDDIIWRFILAYLFATLSMSTVTALAFLFSSFVENSIGPIISTMAVIIVFIIISAINIDFFSVIRPYLFTNYMQSWRDFFSDPLDYGEILKSTAILVSHIAVFFGITIYAFNKKDIVS